MSRATTLRQKKNRIQDSMHRAAIRRYLREEDTGKTQEKTPSEKLKERISQ